jgi:competence protein ComEC
MGVERNVMFIISHSFFGNYNLYQLYSPLINLVFTIFYPLEIVLHLFGFGGMFDGFILKYLHLGDSFIEFKLPICFGIIFLLLSILSFFKKQLFYGINLIALVVIFYVIGVYIV